MSLDEAALLQLKKFSWAALSRFETVCNSYLLAEQCISDGVQGDFVECGVFAGVQSAAMASASKRWSSNRVIRMFDSFEGIPQAGPEDDETITGLLGKGNGSLVTTGISSCSLDQVKGYISTWGLSSENIVYYKGWFQNTVPAASQEIKKIAVLRLDGDLYESTKVCLDYLHEKVQYHGYVIIDDWGLTGCKKACREFWDKHKLNYEEKLIEIPGGGGPVYYKVEF